MEPNVQQWRELYQRTEIDEEKFVKILNAKISQKKEHYHSEYTINYIPIHSIDYW